MNEAIDINKENQKPVDFQDIERERQRKKALFSPIISNNQVFYPREFTRFYEIGNSPYKLGVGVIVLFLDGETYGHPNKSFYPYWVVQAGFATKTSPSVQIKLALLSKKQKALLRGNLTQALNNHGLSGLKRERLTTTDVEWRVPFSESDIELLDQAFRDIIRR